MLRKIALVFALASVSALPVAAQTAAPAAGAADPAFMQQLRTALQHNPEIVMEAINRFQAKQQEAQNQQIEAKVSAVRPEILAAKAVGPVLGNPKGTKTVAEFLDYRCHFCQQVSSHVKTLVESDKDLRVVVVMTPILGPSSETLARYALAADLQGKFAAVHNALYSSTTPIDATDAGLAKFSAENGVDWNKAKVDMLGDAVSAKLTAAKALAEKVEVHGTPFFVTPKTVIPGAAPLEAIKAAI